VLAGQLVCGHALGRMAPDTLAQRECPHLLARVVCGRLRQRRGQIRLDAGCVAWLEAEQSIEVHIVQGSILSTTRVVWTVVSHVGGGLAYAQYAAGVSCAGEG